MKKSQNFRYYYLPLILYAVVIYGFSCLHKVPLPHLDKLSTDKIYHAIEFSILGYLLMRVMNFKLSGKSVWIMVVITTIIGALYGISDEIHQYYVPGRYFSYWDMAADTVGSLLGCWLYLKFRHKTEKLFKFLNR